MNDISLVRQQLLCIIQDSDESIYMLYQQLEMIKQAVQSLNVLQGTTRSNYKSILIQFSETARRLNDAILSLKLLKESAQKWIDGHVENGGGRGHSGGGGVFLSEEQTNEVELEGIDTETSNENLVSDTETYDSSDMNIKMKFHSTGDALLNYLNPTRDEPRNLQETMFGFEPKEDGTLVYDHPDIQNDYMYREQGTAYPEEFAGTCGLCSVANVLRLAGVDVTEKDVIDYASENKLCGKLPFIKILPNSKFVKKINLEILCNNGGTTSKERQDILKHFGIDSTLCEIDIDYPKETINNIGEWVSEGRGVIISVDAGPFYNDEYYNGSGHAVTVTSVTKSKEGKILGFNIVDSNPGNGTRFYTVNEVEKALRPGSFINVTNQIIR